MIELIEVKDADTHVRFIDNMDLEILWDGWTNLNDLRKCLVEYEQKHCGDIRFELFPNIKDDEPIIDVYPIVAYWAELIEVKDVFSEICNRLQ